MRQERPQAARLLEEEELQQVELLFKQEQLVKEKETQEETPQEEP